MNKRTIHLTLASGLVLALALLIAPSCNIELKKHPNVIFISFDDLRPELGCYGNQEIKSPNLDRFAEKGMVFLNTYCQVAVCQPSRASYMTGLRPDSVGSWHLGDHHRGMHPDIVSMPQYFHNYGYYTVSIGKVFHNYVYDSISWDEPDLRPEEYKTPDKINRDAETFHYDDVITAKQMKLRAERKLNNPGKKLYADGWGYGTSVEAPDLPDEVLYDGAQTELAIETIKRLRMMDKPFYLALGYFRPHLPFVAPKKYWDLYKADSITPAPNPFLPVDAPRFAMNSTYELGACYDIAEYQKHPALGPLPDSIRKMLKHGYYASVSYVDACFGRLINALEDMDLMDNTVILLVGDHGWKLGEHGSWCKQTNYENDTHVPMIVYTPGRMEAGKKTTRLTELVDIFPSLCELAGIEVDDYLQGTSIVPLLEDPEREWKAAIFSQFHRRPGVAINGQRYMGYGMRTEKYHYIEWYHWDDEKNIPLDSVTCELYDHTNDPQENYNIAGKAENTNLIIQLSKQLEAGWRAAQPPVGK
ncbi:MAG: sulfatase [Bacteroidota bacterium]|nr:sulfatase [Bacteroidota bacterium]